ncbi:MAG: hypothetical protein LBD48_05895 [Treponema sp.]|nr:hypothetical protein [Treponema sp.]
MNSARPMSADNYPAGTNQTMTRLRGSGEFLADQFADDFRRAVMSYGGLGLRSPRPRQLVQKSIIPYNHTE